MLISKENQIKQCPSCKNDTYSESDIIFSGFRVQTESILTHPCYKIYTCSSCNLVFKSNTPSNEILIEYYKCLDISYENIDYLFPTDNLLIENINSIDKLDLKVLDFGCGSGRVLKNLGYNANKYGVEVNPESIVEAQKNGVEILDENQLDEQYKNYFDVIILSDVFEHLFDPMITLKKLVSSLKTEGKLIIVTGNSDSIRFKRFIGGYWYFRIFSHLQMLNIKHTEWIAEQLNLYIEGNVKCSHYTFSIKRIAAHAIASLLFITAKESSIISAIYGRLPKLRSVIKWEYPSWDDSNKDHLVTIFVKK
jgi:SAM-dependent methyltransferase